MRKTVFLYFTVFGIVRCSPSEYAKSATIESTSPPKTSHSQLPELANQVVKPVAQENYFSQWDKDLCDKKLTFDPFVAYENGYFLDTKPAEISARTRSVGCNLQSTKISKGHQRLAQAFLLNPQLFELKNSDQQNLLHQFVIHDDTVALEAVLQWNVEQPLWQKDRWGRLPFHYPHSHAMARILWGQFSFGHLFVSHFGFYNSVEQTKDDEGMTPIATMARLGGGHALRYVMKKECLQSTLPLVSSLVDHLYWAMAQGASLFQINIFNSPDNQGRTPLALAALANDIYAADALASCSSVRVTDSDVWHRTALHYATFHKDFAAGSRLLIKRPFDFNIDAQDANGDTPLHWAYRCQNSVAISWLANMKARYDVHNYKGELPTEVQPSQSLCVGKTQ
jgi:hypothetical protein